MSAWLREHSPASAELGALHIVEQHARVSVRDDVLDTVVGSAEAALARTSDQQPGGSPFSTARVVIADFAEDALAQAAMSVDALVVGRIAPRAGISPVRLGRVARRLLRRLPAPVMVVPPDVVRSTIGAGPIVLATDLGPRSVSAGQLARQFASDIGRRLVVVHVTPATDEPLFGAASSLALAEPRHSAADIEAWIVANEIGPATPQLLEGDAVERLLAAARTHGAPVVVCGSRRLTTVERIFSSSVGVELARRADCGVLVVP